MAQVASTSNIVKAEPVSELGNNINNNNTSATTANGYFNYDPQIYDTDFDYHDFGDRNYDDLNSDEETGSKSTLTQQQSQQSGYYDENGYWYPNDYDYNGYNGYNGYGYSEYDYQTQQGGGTYGYGHSGSSHYYDSGSGSIKSERRKVSGAQYEYEAQSNELICRWPGCGQKYFTPRDLKRHERTHERAQMTRASQSKKKIKTYKVDDKGWKCDVCGKSFASRSSMKNHYRSQHTQERPYKCSLCDKAYVAKSYLKKHFKMQHDNEKPFACDYPGCGQRFKVNYMLQSHVKAVHTQASKYQCTHCQYGFNKRNDLKKHCLQAHNIDIDVAGHGI